LAIRLWYSSTSTSAPLSFKRTYEVVLNLSLVP
jgi:hypothetical protein